MSYPLSRRHMMQFACLGGVAAMSRLALGDDHLAWPRALGTDSPKICILAARGTDEATMRQWKQVGVDYVVMGGPRIPWQEGELRSIINRFQAGGLTVYQMMIGGFADVIYGRPGRDEQIANVIQSIRAAGNVGLRVIEYNFYAHRLMEGYKEEIGRGGAGYTAYDYELSRNLPPREGVGTHTRAEQLKRAIYFLEAIVPEAEKADVRLALHPNDPPVPLSRGSEQLMDTFEHWKETSHG